MTILNGDHPALETAARWIRREFDIPVEAVVFDKFEKYFNCKITGIYDPWTAPQQVEFNSEQDLVLFLLRWS